MLYDRWQAPDRDSLTTLEFTVNVELGKQIRLLLQMEGRDGKSEREVNQITGEALNRPRRPHKMLERMGVIYEGEDGYTHLTDLGRVIVNAKENSERDFRRSMARIVMSVLRKYQLRNPSDEKSGRYPDYCDIHPYWAIWKAAVALDGKIHWEELNRELMWVLKHSDLDEVIEKLRLARQEPDYNPERGGSARISLRDRAYNGQETSGDRVPEAQVRDQRMTPWFKRAGFGELLLKYPGRDGQGYWTIPDELLDIVREEVQTIPVFKDFSDPQEWFVYYGSLNENEYDIKGGLSIVDDGLLVQVPLIVDERIMRMVRLAIASAPAVMLVGPPGTGKTSILQKVIDEIRVSPESYGFKRAWSAKWVTPEESWTTRDLVGGETIDEKGQIKFRPGHVLEAIRVNQWLVLDEANRADMDRIFGGLLTWLTGHSVELGKASTAVDAPIVILGWSGVPENYCEGVDKLVNQNHDSSPIKFYAGREWRLLGTYNALDAQRVFRFGQALGRRFIRVPIPAMSTNEFHQAIRDKYSLLPDEIIENVVKLYDAHASSTNTMLGPGVFFWIPEYVRIGIEKHGFIGDQSQYEAYVGEDSDSSIIYALLAEAYIAAVGVWLAKLDEIDLDNLKEKILKSKALPDKEWNWILNLLPTLG